MSARIAARFEALRAKGRAGLVTYLMAGDPDLETSIDCVKAAVEAGADLLEIGFPFTDPSADGPAIQRAGERALKGGAGLHSALAAAAAVRAIDPDIPLVLMGYANPALHQGPQRLAGRLAEAGADGIILVDLPPEEDGEVRGALGAAGLSLIRLATPTTDAARLSRILDGASGFLYYVSVAGVTGAGSAAPEQASGALAAVRAQTDLPVALGFGVRDPAAAAAFARFADAVVVGSALVEEAGASPASEAASRVGARVRSLAEAVHAARSGKTEGAAR